MINNKKMAILKFINLFLASLYFLLPEVVGSEVLRLFAKAQQKFTLSTSQNPSNASIYLLWGMCSV
jgi:hypothetical protein